MTGALVMRDVTLIDGTGAPPLENATIVIDDGRIASVSRGAGRRGAGRRDDLGVIAPGKRADLLLLRRNPIDSVGALREIDLVVHDGRAYEPSALLASTG